MAGTTTATRNICVLPPDRPAARGAAFLCAAVVAWMAHDALTHATLAAPPVLQVPSDESFQTDQNGAPVSGPFSLLTGLERRNLLLGDMGGLRTELSKYGISFALQETSEVLGNVTGGVRQGAAYDGLTQMLMQLDTNRAFG